MIRRMLKISWTDEKINGKVLEMPGQTRELTNTIKKSYIHGSYTVTCHPMEGSPRDNSQREKRKRNTNVKMERHCLRLDIFLQGMLQRSSGLILVGTHLFIYQWGHAHFNTTNTHN